MPRRAAWLLRLQLTFACFASAALAQTAPPQDIASDLQALIRSYRSLSSVEGNELVWKDGTRMKIDEGRLGRNHETMLATADIKDMFLERYPVGQPITPPALDVDPGRARNTAFFDKMYGACQTGAVTKNLVDVVWLPKKWGKRVKMTRINGVAEKLAQVSAELDRLPARFDPFLIPPAGTYVCRPIAGTNRVSAHGHGIAIDIASQLSNYWLWAGAKTAGPIPFRNSVPIEIVTIFEKFGFIWGGRWYHYDTMHFEYRPELMPVQQ